jgi:hypothetical protein
VEVSVVISDAPSLKACTDTVASRGSWSIREAHIGGVEKPQPANFGSSPGFGCADLRG